MTSSQMNALAERLFNLFTRPAFLAMEGLANEVPIFIQAYDVAEEDSLRRHVDALTGRLRSTGLVVQNLDLFDMVLDEMAAHGVLDAVLDNEPSFEKRELLETLQNYSDPRTHLIPRLIEAIGEGTQLTLITGPGRVYPFLRTHTILESLQPAMLRHPVVIFFPGEYTQDPGGGSHLRLFGSVPSPSINNPYYRATNLEHYLV